MNDAEARRLDEIARKLDISISKNSLSIKISAAIYVVIFLAVVVYAHIIGSGLRRAVTPDNISAILRNAVQERLPEVRMAINSAARDNAPLLADTVVASLHAAIPLVELGVRDFLDAQVARISDSLKRDLTPIILGVLDENAEAINLTAESLKDQSVAAALVDIFSDSLEEELAKIFDERFHAACNELRDDLDRLRTKSSEELTNKQAVERRLIANWVFLMEYGDGGDLPGGIFQHLGGSGEFMFRGLLEETD